MNNGPLALRHGQDSTTPVKVLAEPGPTQPPPIARATSSTSTPSADAHQLFAVVSRLVPHQGGGPGARDADARVEVEVAADEQGPVERVELLDGVGDDEEPPGAGGHRTNRATRGGRVGWENGAAACLR